jgi:hypothetical protein
LVLQVRSGAADENHKANNVGYPYVLADKVQTAISDETDDECADEDYADSPLDW